MPVPWSIEEVEATHGQVYIRGYLPAQNYQRILEAAVLEWLDGHDALVEASRESPVLNPPQAPGSLAFSDLVSDPPEPTKAARTPAFNATRIDVVRRDAENRRLGVRGEEFVFELEQRRLYDEARRPDLARKVRWVARDEGDGLGYDIASFAEDGDDRLIEVKTTGCGKYFPFAVTRNELERSRHDAERYQLYRLFDFGQRPGLYVLSGALDDVCTLTPTQFRASARRPD